MKGLIAVCGSVCALVPALASAACSLDAGLPNVLNSGDLSIGWQSDPAPVKVGEAFEMQVSICPSLAVLQGVDATMPLHRHGMNYRPSIHSLGEGRWRIEGMIWHMGGQWQLAFSVKLPGDTQAGPVKVTQDVVLP